MASDVPGAHARLAAIDPGASAGVLLAEVLDALLVGAGVDRGVAVDAVRPERPVAVGLAIDSATLLRLTEPLRDKKVGPRVLSPEVALALFEPSTEGLEPRVIPLTAGDETLALVVLPTPPGDPAGFASVAAHAASILAWTRMAEKLRGADFELKYRVWELESLYDVGLSIAGTLDMDAVADDILMKSVSLLNARQGTLIVRNGVEADDLLLKDFGGPLLLPAAVADLPVGVLVSNRRDERLGALADTLSEKLLAVPILSEGKNLGVLVVGDKENRAGGIDDFGPNDVRILSLLGNQAAIALENARLHREAVEKERIEREIELAASIQRAILPQTLPEVPGLAIAGGNKPTRQVGGDFFDVFPLNDGTVALCVADVSGKGVPAALLVSTVHACLHLLLDVETIDLPAIVARANRHLVRFSATRKYATLFLARFDPRTRELTYVNAGHNPGILLSGSSMQLLPSSGVPIGMLPGAVHHEERRTLAKGDLLALYSDGITEAVNGLDEEFGMERLEALLCRRRDEPVADVSRHVFEAVNEFTRGVAQYDDQTVLVARVE